MTFIATYDFRPLKRRVFVPITNVGHMFLRKKMPFGFETGQCHEFQFPAN